MKTFWKYIYHEQMNIVKFIKKPVFYEYLVSFILICIVLSEVLFNKTTSLNAKAFTFLCWIIVITFLKFYALYKSGVHIGWNRRRLGIPTGAEIKRLKAKQFKLKQPNFEDKVKHNQKVVGVERVEE